MPDTHTEKQRSYNMSQIKRRDTSIELNLRKYIWARGLRGYRVDANIKGKPDLYFPKHEIAVFVDGCFWHKCPECFIRPKSNTDYWDSKIKRNVERDRKINKELKDKGVQVVRFWEHEVREDVESCFGELKESLNN